MVLADEILFGKLQNGGKAKIDLGEDGLTFRYDVAVRSQPVAVSAEV